MQKQEQEQEQTQAMATREKSKQTQTLPVAGTGWIYCLSNPAMPGLVKVGAVLTNNSRGYPLNMEYAFDDAMDVLNSPGVPALFNVEMSELSQDPIADVEFIHAILDSANYRYGILNPNAPPLRYSCARNAHNRDFFTAPVEMVMRAFAECRSRGPNGQITNLQKEETAPGGGEMEKEGDNEDEDEDEEPLLEPRMVRTENRAWEGWSAYCDQEKARRKENGEDEIYEKDHGGDWCRSLG